LTRLPPPPPTKTVVRDDRGGVIKEYADRWKIIGAAGGEVEVVGVCGSACTLVTAYVARDKLCFGQGAALYFHQARRIDGQVAWDTTQWMVQSYPAGIRDMDQRPRRLPQGADRGLLEASGERSMEDGLLDVSRLIDPEARQWTLIFIPS